MINHPIDGPMMHARNCNTLYMQHNIAYIYKGKKKKPKRVALIMLDDDDDLEMLCANIRERRKKKEKKKKDSWCNRKQSSTRSLVYCQRTNAKKKRASDDGSRPKGWSG
jgi:hypothetical protein